MNSLRHSLVAWRRWWVPRPCHDCRHPRRVRCRCGLQAGDLPATTPCSSTRRNSTFAARRASEVTVTLHHMPASCLPLPWVTTGCW